MKKLSTAILLVGVSTLILSGCTTKQGAKLPAEEIVTEVTESTEEETSVKENDPLEISFSEKTFDEMNEFIELHKSTATQEEKDEMILQYDEQLREAYKTLSTKFNDMKYFTAVNDTKDEQYVLHIDKIADASIRSEALALMDAGFGFQMQEGSYYLEIDYVKVNLMFEDIMSEALKPYYGLRSDETKVPVTVEEYLNISFDEVYNRVSTLETFIKNNPKFRFRQDAIVWLNSYMGALLSVHIYSGAVDYETGFVSEKVKTAYEKVMASDLIIAKNAVKEMNAVIEKFDGIIKMDNNEAVEAVSQVRNNSYNSLPTLVDEYYPAE